MSSSTLLDFTNVMPSANTPTPMCAIVMPTIGADTRRPRRSRSSGSTSEDRMIQMPSTAPIGVSGSGAAYTPNTTASPSTSAIPKVTSRVRRDSPSAPRRQRAWIADRQQREHRQHRHQEARVEVRRPDRERAQAQRIGDQRRHRAAEHDRRRDHEQQVVEQQEGFARQHLEPAARAHAAAHATRTASAHHRS